jgi:hypothetical protein
MRPRGVSLALLVALSGQAVAAERLNSEQLREEITGNTLTGFNTSGVVFSEYHAPDGRVFGHNNGVPVVDGCWAIRGDAICYYYNGQKPLPAAFCWHYDRAGAKGYRITSVDLRITGAARLEPGNPRNHNEGERSWVCEGLISRLRTPLAPVSVRLDRRP